MYMCEYVEWEGVCVCLYVWVIYYSQGREDRSKSAAKTQG